MLGGHVHTIENPHAVIKRHQKRIIGIITVMASQGAGANRKVNSESDFNENLVKKLHKTNRKI